MPVYEYQCSACKVKIEVQQKIADAPIKECPECKGELKKLISKSSFQLVGNCWANDGYSKYNEKKEND